MTKIVQTLINEVGRGYSRRKGVGADPTSQRPVVKNLSSLIKKITSSDNDKAIDEWDTYSDDALDVLNVDVWSDAPDEDIKNAIDVAEDIIAAHNMDEANTTGAGESYNTPNAFSKSKKKNKHKKSEEYTYAEPSIYETLLDRIDLVINEASYKDFKNDPDQSAKQKINLAIQEVAKKLREIDRKITHASKLRNEAGLNQDAFWKSTSKRFTKISDRMLKIHNKLREFNK